MLDNVAQEILKLGGPGAAIIALAWAWYKERTGREEQNKNHLEQTRLVAQQRLDDQGKAAEQRHKDLRDYADGMRDMLTQSLTTVRDSTQANKELLALYKSSDDKITATHKLVDDRFDEIADALKEQKPPRRG